VFQEERRACLQFTAESSLGRETARDENRRDHASAIELRVGAIAPVGRHRKLYHSLVKANGIEQSAPTRLFLSYSRSDREPFVWRLYEGLKAAGFDVWFDRVSMRRAQLAFSAEIETAISACDRLVLIGRRKRRLLRLRHARAALRVPRGREVRQS
jgi:hypothetical protein